MGIGDVVAQKNGAGSLSDLAEQMEGASSDSSESSGTPATTAPGAPSLTFTMGGTQYTLSAQTLMFYGIVLADVLLLYIATRV